MSSAKARKSRQRLRASCANRKPKMTLAETPWDHGATGQANRIGLVVEERGEKDATTGKVTNPNGVTGVRRVDLLEFWHRRGSITTEGYNAAEKLRDAFEATMQGKPALPDNDRVQSSPKPDHAVTIQIDRISRFDYLMRHVHFADRRIVIPCVLEGKHPSSVYGPLASAAGFQHLRMALGRLSDALAKSRKAV